MNSKQKTHQLVARALAKGLLVQKACEVCGDGRTHAHHEDYSQPLKVVWLCRSHHMLRHEEIKKKGLLHQRGGGREDQKAGKGKGNRKLGYTMLNKQRNIQEHRSSRVAGYLRPELYDAVKRVMKSRRWSFSDCIEEGLYILIRTYGNKKNR